MDFIFEDKMKMETEYSILNPLLTIGYDSKGEEIDFTVLRSAYRYGYTFSDYYHSIPKGGLIFTLDTLHT